MKNYSGAMKSKGQRRDRYTNLKEARGRDQSLGRSQEFRPGRQIGWSHLGSDSSEGQLALWDCLGYQLSF